VTIPEELIARIARCLDDKKISYMIIGGQAILLYGRPRLTRDIDITLGVDFDQFELIAGVCKEMDLKILPVEPAAFAAQTRVLPAEDSDSKLRVDFVFSFTEYEKQALKRIREVKLAGYPVRFASREDVIIHKMLAGRAIDEEDVKSILIKKGEEIDFGYVKEWLAKFEVMPEFVGVGKKFEELSAQ
jgi:predicted nucleotidyltransferase